MMNSRAQHRQEPERRDHGCDSGADESSCDLCVLHALDPQLLQPQQQPHGRRGSRSIAERIPAVTIAAMQGRLEHVVHWIEHAECGVDTVDFMGTMPLHRAALEGHVHIVEYLITRGAALQTRVLDVKDTVLHLAAAKGHAKVVKTLLNAGAHVDARNADNYTPLLAAIRSNQLQSAQVLIAYGASVSAPWTVDQRDVGTCLHLAAQYGHLELTKFLLGVVALDVNQKTRHRKATPLHFAARHGQLEIAQYLVERHRADVRARDDRGMTPLHYACDFDYHLTMPIEQHPAIERKHVDIVSCLLKAGANVKPRRLRDHATPLRCAAMRGHFQIAKTLLDRGARGSRTTRWLFALLWAARDPHKLKFLLSSAAGGSAGAPSSNQSSVHTGSRKPSSDNSSSNAANTTKRGTSRDSMSSCGTQPESPTGLTMLLDRDGGFSNRVGNASSRSDTAREGDRRTALHSACLDANLTLLLKLLGNASPTKRSHDDDENDDSASILEARLLPDGLTALHIASRDGWLRGVTALVKCSANVDAQTNAHGSTPLHLAAEQGHIAVIKQLVQHGADVSTCDYAAATPVLVALRNGRSGAMKYLLRHGENGRRSSISGCLGSSSTGVSLGDIVFAYTQAHDDEEKDAGEDDEGLVRIFNPKRTTALHIAAFYGRVEIVRQLVCEGEDVEARDQDGATPLWIAALMGHLDVVELLAEQGANLNAVTKTGASVALGAAEFGHLEVLEFLTAPTPAQSFERLSLTRLSLQDHTSDRLSLTSMST